MPELPDVETYKRYMDATALKQKIARVDVPSPSLLDHLTPQSLGRHLKGTTFAHTRRHGKYLFIQTENHGWLVLHFGMTGRLEYVRGEHAPAKGTGLAIRFTNGAELAYIAPRKLGHIAWTDDADAFVESKHLGPDAMATDLAQFRALAAQRKGAVKSWLMDQKAIAGIGNVYSDEVLLRAGVHPQAAVPKLDKNAVGALHRAIKQVLQQAIKAKADPERMPKSFLLPNREEGAPCPRCGGEVNRVTAAGRSAYYCPKCQPRP